MNSSKKTHLTLLTSTVNGSTIKQEVRVEITKFASKQLEKLPNFILEKVSHWISSIKFSGLEAVRVVPGYHDEPLKGARVGQRSIRLNRAWRLIYEVSESENRTYITVIVLEVNKHAY